MHDPGHLKPLLERRIHKTRLSKKNRLEGRRGSHSPFPLPFINRIDPLRQEAPDPVHCGLNRILFSGICSDECFIKRKQISLNAAVIKKGIIFAVIGSPSKQLQLPPDPDKGSDPRHILLPVKVVPDPAQSFIPAAHLYPDTFRYTGINGEILERQVQIQFPVR